MTLRRIFSQATIAVLAAASLAISGCATVAPDSGRTAASDSAPSSSLPISMRSLRISEDDASAGGNESLPLNQSLPIVELSAPATVAQAIDLTRDAEDLLQRIRNGFSMPDIDNELVLSHQQWYMGHPDYLRRMLDRSSLYMHYIVEELEKRGMPTELALLPMVESAYNPMALSRSKASGLWQFIPSTGKHFNLDQTWWKDERRDIVASTNAALDYLQSIYEMHGDWHLALASYNWGEGAVGRAIAKNQAQGLPSDYLSLTMPTETKNYVPKLQALKNIFRNPTLMAGLDLPTISNRAYFGTVTQHADIDVKVAAKLAEMSVQEFVALNPSHNRPVIKSETPLVLPAEKVKVFLANLKAYENSKQPLSSWQSYTARSGDRLDRIARRFGMSLARLKEVNEISGRSTKVRPGTTLLVAGSDDAAATVAVAAANGATPDRAEARAEPRNSGKAKTAQQETYTVRRNDTLFAIARRYDVSVAELKSRNNLRSNTIAAGTKLVVSSATRNASGNQPAVAAASPSKSSAVADKAARSIAIVKRYTVQRGDTLTSIARQFKVSADDLLRWNRVSPRSLRPGQTLTIQLAQNP